eukprot:m.103921 g.103921  ORF g.103921 m.103921 type:complete len:576 (-) comp27529_c0_seq1:155-1882(-)
MGETHMPAAVAFVVTMTFLFWVNFYQAVNIEHSRDLRQQEMTQILQSKHRAVEKKVEGDSNLTSKVLDLSPGGGATNIEKLAVAIATEKPIRELSTPALTQFQLQFQKPKLPVACAKAYDPTRPAWVPEWNLQDFSSPKRKVTEVRTLDQLPSKYYVRTNFTSVENVLLPNVLTEESKEIVSAMDKWWTPTRPDSVVMYCFPSGFGVDSALAGPADVDKVDKLDEDRYVLFLNKFWYANRGDALDMGRRNIKTIDVPGLVVQLSGWTSFVFNHFSLDTMIRLSMVLEALKSDDPLWGTAKLLVPFQGRQKVTDEGEWLKPELDNIREGALWVYERLGLTDRLLPATGWAVKAVSTYRAEFMVLPDVYPHPGCDESEGRKRLDPWFPRGALLPLQRRIGVFEPVNRNLVIYAGRGSQGLRSVDVGVETAMIKQITNAINKRNAECPEEHQGKKIEFHNFAHEHPEPNGGSWPDFEVMRRAIVVIGPHGQQLWNAAFCRPGTVIVEFTSVNGIDKSGRSSKKFDCRQSGWELFNAAGHDHWIEQPHNFGFFVGKMQFNATNVETIVEWALGNYTWQV